MESLKKRRVNAVIKILNFAIFFMLINLIFKSIYFFNIVKKFMQFSTNYFGLKKNLTCKIKIIFINDAIKNIFLTYLDTKNFNKKFNSNLI